MRLRDKTLNSASAAVTTYLTHLVNDYRSYTVEEYHRVPDKDAAFYTVTGTKRLKVVIRMYEDSDSAHSWIVTKDDPKLGHVVGDILKAATWKAPATNYTRGNVFSPDSYTERARWTGVS
jgi:hypothetical protein